MNAGIGCRFQTKRRCVQSDLSGKRPNAIAQSLINNDGRIAARVQAQVIKRDRTASNLVFSKSLKVTKRRDPNVLSLLGNRE